jgi:RND family efflux transporter MFP subunit
MLPLACGQEQPESAELIRPVRSEPAIATGGTRIRTFSGTAQAGIESRLSFKVPGTVQELAVRVGDAVRKGQTLARLDDHDYRLQVQEAEAALAQAQAQERNARSAYDRTRGLYETRGASKQDLDAARAAFESASAQVASIEKRLELARLQVTYAHLKAPFDGAVATVQVEKDENISAGMPVMTLNAGGRPEVRISVPEVLIAQVRPGSPVKVTFAALPGQTLDASVTEVGVAASGFATAFPVTVRMRETADQVRPGMAAEVAITFETSGTQECLIVRSEAVGEDRNGRFVYVIEPGGEGVGLAKRRTVTIGDLTSEGLEILSGLEEGELVITAGVSRIVDGQRVKVL